jgi:hypothetical protein
MITERWCIGRKFACFLSSTPITVYDSPSPQQSIGTMAVEVSLPGFKPRGRRMKCQLQTWINIRIALKNRKQIQTEEAVLFLLKRIWLISVTVTLINYENPEFSPKFSQSHIYGCLKGWFIALILCWTLSTIWSISGIHFGSWIYSRYRAIGCHQRDF